MPFPGFQEPLIRCKQTALDVQDLCGLLRVHLRIHHVTLFSALYTRVDQAILLWAILSVIIFGTAQFWPMSWTIQAILWSSFTVIGVVVMQVLTHFWATVERLNWVVWMWALLMLSGLLLTDIGIFGGLGWVLVNLCPLWLALSGIGYFLTGLGMRSRTFLMAGSAHFVAIALLPLIPGWSFLGTGLVIGGTLWLLSELQWDMRPPIETVKLTVEEQRFNQQQRMHREG